MVPDQVVVIRDHRVLLRVGVPMAQDRGKMEPVLAVIRTQRSPLLGGVPMAQDRIRMELVLVAIRYCQILSRSEPRHLVPNINR